MTSIDYENLFIYMSLIFAVCIFITLLYFCVFAGGAQVFENFGDGTDNMKEQILLLLKDLKNKETTSETDKADLDVIIKTFSSSNVNVNDLVAIIKHLKKFAPDAPEKQESPETPAASDTPDTPAVPEKKVPKKDVYESRLDTTSQPSTESVQSSKAKIIQDDMPESPPSTPVELRTIKSLDK
jgi:hypothetical protein